MEERSTDLGLDVQLYMLDFDVSTPVPDHLDHFYFRAGAAIGVAHMDYQRPFKDITTGAAELRIGFEYRPNPQFSLHFDVGGIALGEPGKTEAVGGYLTVGCKVTF